MLILWIYGRRLLEWIVIWVIGHAILLALNSYGIYPDRTLANLITGAAQAPIWLGWLLSGIFGLVGVILLEMLWSSRSSAKSKAISETKHNNDPPIPDMTIHDLFFHIRSDVLENANEKRWQKIGDEIRDKLAVGQLKAWGRTIDPKTERQSALTVIPENYWADAEFTCIFMEAGQERSPHSWTPKNPPPTKNDYADVQFNRAQVFKIWPQRFKEIGIKVLVPDTPRKPIPSEIKSTEEESNSPLSIQIYDKIEPSFWEATWNVHTVKLELYNKSTKPVTNLKVFNFRGDNKTQIPAPSTLNPGDDVRFDLAAYLEGIGTNKSNGKIDLFEPHNGILGKGFPIDVSHEYKFWITAAESIPLEVHVKIWVEGKTLKYEPTYVP